MSQERLNRLDIVSIEKEILIELEYKNLINNYISRNNKKFQNFKILYKKLITFIKYLNIKKYLI